MNKLIIADIDPHVAQPPSRIEEEKISGDQLAPFHAQSHQGLLKGRPRKVDVEELIGLLHEIGRAHV